MFDTHSLSITHRLFKCNASERRHVSTIGDSCMNSGSAKVPLAKRNKGIWEREWRMTCYALELVDQHYTDQYTLSIQNQFQNPDKGLSFPIVLGAQRVKHPVAGPNPAWE